jgi:hypothetical protein
MGAFIVINDDSAVWSSSATVHGEFLAGIVTITATTATTAVAVNGDFACPVGVVAITI